MLQIALLITFELLGVLAFMGLILKAIINFYKALKPTTKIHHHKIYKPL